MTVEEYLWCRAGLELRLRLELAVPSSRKAAAMRLCEPRGLRRRAGRLAMLGAFACALRLVTSPAFAGAAPHPRPRWGLPRAVCKAISSSCTAGVPQQSRCMIGFLCTPQQFTTSYYKAAFGFLGCSSLTNFCRLKARVAAAAVATEGGGLDAHFCC